MKLEKYLSKQGLKQAEFARKLGYSPGLIWQWLHGHPVAAEKVLEIEKATDGAVTRYELRPDLYPRETATN